jgi:starvation-inducible DNA-binding protein
MTFSGSFNNAQIPQLEEKQLQEGPEPEEKASVEQLITQLVSLSSYLHQLYTQSHLLHLNVEGPLFLPIHKFLGEQYEAHIDQFDTLAEFIRSMDFLLPMCERGLLGAYKGFKHVKSYETRDGLTVYLKNLEACGFMAKDIQKIAKEVDAPDIENYLAELVGAMFKAAWFLKSTLRP